MMMMRRRRTDPFLISGIFIHNRALLHMIVYQMSFICPHRLLPSRIILRLHFTFNSATTHRVRQRKRHRERERERLSLFYRMR